MKAKFKENDIHILNCMQDIILNDPANDMSFIIFAKYINLVKVNLSLKQQYLIECIKV